MPKFNVFILDDLDRRVLLKFSRLKYRKARWVAKQWKKQSVIGTSVLICDEETHLPVLPHRSTAVQSLSSTWQRV